MQKFTPFCYSPKLVVPLAILFKKSIGYSAQNISTNHFLQRSYQTISINKPYIGQTRVPTFIRIMSSSAQTDLRVEHDASLNKFFIKLGSDEAKLEYQKKGDILNMWHTEVPPALQGKGIAKILAQEAFDYAVKQNLKMKLTCTYLQKFYKDNPKEEYKALVV